MSGYHRVDIGDSRNLAFANNQLK